MKKVLIIQNDEKEGAGQIGHLLQKTEIEATVILGWDLQPDVPLEFEYDGLVILGGAQSVASEDLLKYLELEIQVCNRFIQINRPILGVCLGGQIVAAALGAKIKSSDKKEIGWYKITSTLESVTDQLIRDYPRESLAFHFHGDYFDLPPHCTKLSFSELTPCQAFRYSGNVYGFQYHLEVDQALIKVMCESNAAFMRSNGFDKEAVILESKKYIEQYQKLNESVIENWTKLI